MTIGPADLVGQFILCESENNIPADWPVRSNGTWRLGSHPSLPIVDILAHDSTVIGWLLGYPVSPDGRLVTENVRFEVSPDDSDVADRFESSLYAYGGRFAAVCLAGQTSRFYLDPIGSLAAVFCPRQRIVASTPTLVPELQGDGERQELVYAVGVPDRTCWGPFGLTPRRSVERVLPNHFVDLAKWESVRHWPVGEVPVVRDVQAAVYEIASILKRNISAVARDYPLHMSVTAGRDSRMLLACARDHVEEIVFFTYTDPEGRGKLDRQIAPRIARRFGLNHVFVPSEQPSQTERDEWSYRTGGCVGGTIALPIRVCKQLDLRRAVLLGVAGEIGRGFHWRKGDSESSRIAPDDLLEKRHIPLTREFRGRAQRWLEGLPLKNALTIWGLLYNEEFNGCWFGPQHYGHVSNALHICPFSHRRILEIMLGLPTEYRRGLMLSRDLVESEWPELLAIPFNWPVGVRRYVYAVKWRARLVRKKLASLMSPWTQV